MRKLLIVIAVVALMPILAGCAQSASAKSYTPVKMVDVSDLPQPKQAEAEQVQAVETASAVAVDESEPLFTDDAVSCTEECESAPYSGSECANTDGLNAYTGVNYHDGRRETYYSSQILYHYRTPEWTLDDEGFYRDEQGRYVVAASDMEQGTVFEGSKGTCVVLDSGCAPGTTDYYVNWL